MQFFVIYWKKCQLQKVKCYSPFNKKNRFYIYQISGNNLMVVFDICETYGKTYNLKVTKLGKLRSRIQTNDN